MKFNDNITLDIADAVRDVLEGKVKKEEAKYPHDMFHPETGEKEVAKDEAEHKALKDKGYTHEKPEVDEVAEPRAKGEKDFKKMHTIKKVGVKADLDGTVITKESTSLADIETSYADALSKINEAQSAAQKAAFKKMLDAKKDSEDDDDTKKEAKADDTKKEAKADTPDGPSVEESEKQKKYQAFFQKALKKYGVKSPSELEGDKKKEFFDYIDKNYEAEDESD